jgi:hypothetical protein
MDKKDFRIITTTNENDTYLPFWPTMAQHWKNFCGFGNVTLGFITERDETDPLVEEMRQYGEVILIKPIEKIDVGIQSKVSRMYLASERNNENCIIADIDMYILNKNYLWDNWFPSHDPHCSSKCHRELTFFIPCVTTRISTNC